MNRRVLIVAAVVAFHLFALWALQNGLLRRAVELVIPVQVLAEFIEAPQPLVTPEPTPPQPVPKPVAKPVVQPKPKPKPRPAPQPVATPDPQPALPTAPVGAIEPPTPEPTAETTAEAAPPSPPAPPAPPAPPKIELPSSSAKYLNNAPPTYPPLSKRLGEQGKVVIRVLIDVNGTASQASIKTSSGYQRLDQTALQTVSKWRYVPGKRAGVPEAMWFNIPLNFVLE